MLSDSEKGKADNETPASAPAPPGDLWDAEHVSSPPSSPVTGWKCHRKMLFSPSEGRDVPCHKKHPTKWLWVRQRVREVPSHGPTRKVSKPSSSNSPPVLCSNFQSTRQTANALSGHDDTYGSRFPGADKDRSSLLLPSNGFPKDRFRIIVLTKICKTRLELVRGATAFLAFKSNRNTQLSCPGN